MLCLPFLFLAMLELALRLGGYGYATDFFSKMRAPDGTSYLVNSDTFSLRFFPPGLARWTGPFKIPAEKPLDVRRIFVFGESAAMGDPQPSYGVSRYLEVLLRERFPGQKFEVINLGITAVNSHVILPIARECAHQQGDVWIIYMGNNEMVGPFGAATVFGWQAPPLAVVRSYLALQKTRVGQFLVASVRGQADQNTNSSWGGMQMFLHNQIPPTDRRKETVYHHFESNLRELVETGVDSGAKVILSTMSVNLRDCPPFASLANTNLPVADQEQFKKLYAQGSELEKGSNYVEAARFFKQAAGLDPHFAELQFRWADCLLALTNSAARAHFQLACDDDALPFRADSRINGVIRALGQKFGGTKFMLCDAEAELQKKSPGGAVGDDVFFEHVHFNFDGNYQLARAWAEKVEHLIFSDESKAQPKVLWASQEQCEKELGLSDYNRAYELQTVVRRMGQPPLSSQFNNSTRLELVRAKEKELQQQLKRPDAVSKARQLYADALVRAPGDNYLHEGLANLLESLGDIPGAVNSYSNALNLQPQDYYSRLRLGHLLGQQGKLGEAAKLLSQVVATRPSLPESWYELGLVQKSQQEYSRALASFDRACQLRPQELDYQYHKVFCQGRLLAGQHRRAEAMAEYRKAIDLLPNDWEAHFQLGGELDAANRLDEATQQFAAAAQCNPGYSRTHFNYGVLLAKQERFEEARHQFEEAIRLEPGYANARDCLAKIRARQASGR